MCTASYFIALDINAFGENGDLLGSDESDISQVNFAVIDIGLNKVIKYGKYNIRREKCFENGVDDQAISNQDMDENIGRHEVSLKQAIEQIDEKVIDASLSDQKEVYFVTDGQLHLRQCLHPRAMKYSIPLKQYYFQFFDVRKEYRKWSGRDYLTSLTEIAEDAKISIKFIYEDVSEECCLCTAVVMELLKKCHVFESLEVIMDYVQPGMSSGYVKDETIARVRGLPWQVSDHDVASFFKGLNIARGGIALCLNSKGRRNGEALVRFENEQHRHLALKRHKHHLSGRYIEVYKGSAQDFIRIARGPSGAMNATVSFLANGGSVIIRMRGLPYTSCARDVVEFFNNDPAVLNGDGGIMLVLYPDGTATGDAFALFGNEEDGKLALKKHREKIGNRYVELFRSTQAELQQVLTMYNVGYRFVSPVGVVSPLMPPLVPLAGTLPSNVMENCGVNQRAHALMSMSCLRLRGLPFSATKDNIVDFLSHFSKGMIGGVYIIYNLQGRPSGESFVQLKSVELASRAANELHLKHMGERYIEVFQCSLHDMSLMLATSYANQMASSHMKRINSAGNNSYIQSSHHSIQHVHNLLGSSLALHPMISTSPAVFNATCNQISPTLNPVGILPGQLLPWVRAMAPNHTFSYPMNPFGKPNGITCLTYQAHDDGAYGIPWQEPTDNQKQIGKGFFSLAHKLGH